MNIRWKKAGKDRHLLEVDDLVATVFLNGSHWRWEVSRRGDDGHCSTLGDGFVFLETVERGRHLSYARRYAETFIAGARAPKRDAESSVKRHGADRFLRAVNGVLGAWANGEVNSQWEAMEQIKAALEEGFVGEDGDFYAVFADGDSGDFCRYDALEQAVENERERPIFQCSEIPVFVARCIESTPDGGKDDEG